MFTRLLDNPDNLMPGDLQKKARATFHSAVQASRFLRWNPNEEPPDGLFVGMGIGIYSIKDLELLDDLQYSSVKWEKTVTIAVEDPIDCPKYDVSSTPFCIVFSNRKHVETKIGLLKSKRFFESLQLL